jgi:hypothetical protein
MWTFRHTCYPLVACIVIAAIAAGEHGLRNVASLPKRLVNESVSRRHDRIVQHSSRRERRDSKLGVTVRTSGPLFHRSGSHVSPQQIINAAQVDVADAVSILEPALLAHTTGVVANSLQLPTPLYCIHLQV